MDKKRKGNPKQIVIFVILISIIFVVYFLMTNKKEEDTVKAPSTEVEKLLAKDLTTDYPATPTSVVKLYSRISKSLYNEKWDNKEVNELIAMIRLLYSQELLEKNPEEKYLTSFKADIADYQDKKKEIMTYRVDGNSQVLNWEENKIEFASLNAVYSMAEKQDHFKIYEKFVLKKENNQWKIVGWTDISEVDIIEE